MNKIFLKHMKFRNKKLFFFRHILSAPFIYSVFPPLVLLDLWLEIYHRICFPLYGIPFVSRRKYIDLDRHLLPDLNLIEKINCIYCGYANGWITYAAEIGARTEAYWCGIKHDKVRGEIHPKHQEKFAERIDYGEEN